MDRNNLNYSVYVHTNKINGKKYVGQSSNIVERWRNGGKNYFSSIKFFRAIQKYGWENFTHEILYENLNKEAANKIERDLIRKYDSINNGYNIQEGGYTSLTQSSLDKMSKSLKQGYLDHPERRQKISEKLIGNMCKADYYGSSITDERHFALYIKDTIDDEDAGDGTTMRRWYATMVANGTMVDWEDVI